MLDDGIISFNPIPDYRRRYLHIFKDERRPERQLIEKSDFEKLIWVAEKPYERIIILLGGTTGLRREEMRLLSLKDLDFENLVIHVPEHPKRTRCVSFLTPQMADYLVQYFKWREFCGEILYDESPVIVGPISKKRIDEDRITEACKRLGKAVGVHKDGGRIEEKFTTHNLRHFFTSMMLDRGMRREYVDDLRGDLRDGASRERYYHIPIKKLHAEFNRCTPHYDIPEDLFFKKD